MIHHLGLVPKGPVLYQKEGKYSNGSTFATCNTNFECLGADFWDKVDILSHVDQMEGVI